MGFLDSIAASLSGGQGNAPPDPSAAPQGGDISQLAQPTGGQIPQSGANNAAMNPQPQPPQQPQHPQQPPMGPQLTGVKGYLSNIFYQMGEGMKVHLGMPTELQTRQKQQELNIQQQRADAETFDKQSEAQWRQQQTAQNAQGPVTDQREADSLSVPVGTMLSPAQKFAIYKSKAEMAGKANVAQIGATARLGAAQITALSRMSQTTMKAAYMPDPANPEQTILGVGLYDKAGNFRGYAENAVVPAAYLEKIHHGQEFKIDVDGNLHEIPTTSTSQPLVPPNPAQQPQNKLIQGPQAPNPSTLKSILTNGAAQAGKVAQNPQGVIPALQKGAGVFKAPTMMVGADSQGRQIAGTAQELQSASVNSFTKLSSGEADKVNIARQLTSPNGLFGLIDKDLAQFKDGELEGLGPRWNEFLAGTIGAADPRYVALRTHLTGLLSTALMQAHVGSRGGERIMEHFQDLANAGKMSLPTLKAAITAERQYVEEKAMRPLKQKQWNPKKGQYE